MPTCPDCGETVAPDESRCAACGAVPAETTADAVDAAADTTDVAATSTDELSARAAGTRPPEDDAYMAPPGEWTPPERTAQPTRTRPDVAPLGTAATLRWAARAVAARPVASAPFLVAGVAGAAAAGASGLALLPAAVAPRASPAATLLSALALAAAVPGVAAAALVAEAAATEGEAATGSDGVAPDPPSGGALLRAAVPRLRGVAAASVAAAALTFVGYVFFVLPGAVLGPKVSLAPHAAALDGTGPVESLERSWRRTRGRLWTVVGVWAAGAAVVALSAVAPVAGALAGPPVASVGAVALARVYLEGG